MVQEATEPVSFEIRQGERIVLDGKNGSGKSSLLKLVVGLVVRVQPVFLRDGRDMDDQVEVVVHDREAPHLDPAEVGDGDDP